MQETICKVEEKFNHNGKIYYILIDIHDNKEYITPIDQLFEENLEIGKEYIFYKQYNTKLEKYILIQKHPIYELHKNYEFPIIQKELCREKLKIERFILNVNNHDVSIRALQSQYSNWEKETLSCQVIAYNKSRLRLRNNDFSNLPYKINDVYEFIILGFGEYINNRNQIIPSVILKIFDSLEVNVTAMQWQNEKLWSYQTLSCEVLKFNSVGIPHLKNRDERHPIFEIDNVYEFEVIKFKTKQDFRRNKIINIIELKGLDNCKHETYALPGQIRSLKKGDKIECIVQSIGFNLRLAQTNIKDPYFVPINEIIKDKELISKYFEKAISDKLNEDSLELINQYESDSAFWVFTFCNKILIRYFKEYIEKFDYKSSINVATMLITIENWIINNGIISSFSDENLRQVTLLKAKRQLKKYSKIKDVLLIIKDLNYSEFFNKDQIKLNNTDIEDLYYIVSLSDINQIEESLLLSYLISLLNNSELNKHNDYHLKLLDKCIEAKKKKYYNDEYERSFNLSFKNNDLFESDFHRNKYFTLSYCQFLINEKLNNHERSNYIIGKILRQFFYSVSNFELKQRILYNAYFYHNNHYKVKDHLFNYIEELEIDENKLLDNPNLTYSKSDNWSEIRSSFQDEKTINAEITQRLYNGFLVEYKGIKGFLPSNHVIDRNLKNYPYTKIDFTVTVNCFLISEEFYFFIAKQHDLINENCICINNLTDEVQVNDIIVGRVKSIEDYGVFITNYWGDGLLHRTNISSHYWNKETLQLYFKVGDEITTKVINIQDNKIDLSVKALVGTSDEDKYYDLINYIDYGDDFTQSNNSSVITDFINKDDELKFNQLEKAFCFEQFAMLTKSLDNKIHYLRLSKQFFSSINSSRSYLINIYIAYFELLKLIEEIINSFSIAKVDKIKKEAQTILEKVSSQQQTLEVYPDTRKLIFFLNIIKLFNDTSDSGMESLYDLLQKNLHQKTLKTIAKITLANNLLVSAAEKDSDFIRKNLRLIKSYINDGVLSLKENEIDKRERELREENEYWKRKISEDEGENLEFKSSFMIPIPDDKRLKEKFKLLNHLETNPNNQSILKKISQIDGDLASKLIIHSSLKTLCAFSNTNGGTLLIGVTDTKKIIGLEKDFINIKTKQDRDGFGLFFDEKIKEYFEPSFSSLLKREFLKFPDGDILIVKVKQSVDPVFLLKDKEGKPCEELYIRNLTSTKEIKSKKDLVKFIKQKEKEQLKSKIDN